MGHLDLLAADLEGQLARSMVPPSARHAAQNLKRPARTPRLLRVVYAVEQPGLVKSR